MIKDKNNIPKLIKEFKAEAEQILREIGAMGEQELKLTLTEGRPEWPPLSPVTIKKRRGKRKSTKPLIDTGIMRASITYRVEAEKGIVKIGLFSDHSASGERSGEENVIIGLVHEFGATGAGRGHKVTIPPRPWLRPTADEKIFPESERIIKERIGRVIDKNTFRV